MKAVVLEEKERVVIKEVPESPLPGPGELLIEPRTVGICGSDLHYVQHGRIGHFIVEAPMILGHEASGVVAAVGPGVSGFEVGDRVVLEPGIPDSSSRASREGMYNVDPAVRFFATPPVDGCLVERVVHPAAFTYHLPDHVSYAEGAFVEPLAVGVHAATKARIKPGDVAVVVGSGTVGMLVAASALAAGASKALVSDVAAAKLELAARIPGVIPVDVTEKDLLEAVLEETGGWGADVVFEASGSPKAYESLWRLGAPGNRTVLVGMPPENISVDVIAMQARETRVETIFRYANVHQKAIDLIAGGRIDVKPFVSASFPLEESLAAFDRVAEARPSDVKIQIIVSED